MCVKCGYTIGYNQNKVAENAAKIQLAQGLANGILGLFEYGFNEIFTQDSGNDVQYTPKKEVADKPEKEVEKETPEEAVKRLVDVDTEKNTELFNDLVKRYNLIKEKDSNFPEAMIKLRLGNYVKGYNHQIESLKQQAEQERVVNYVDKNLAKDAKNRDQTLNLNVIKILNKDFNENKITYDRELVKTNKDLQNHFKALGNQYLESRDSNADLGLDFYEIFENNLAQHYYKNGIYKDYREALQKAHQYVENNKVDLKNKFESWNNQNIAEFSEESNPEELLALNSYLEFSKFNSSSNESLDSAELAEMLLAKSTYADGENPDYDISAADSYAFEIDLVNNPNALDSYLKNARTFMTTEF